MRRSNTADYPLEPLQPLIDYFSPAKIDQLNLDRHCLVADHGGRIVGTAALEGEQLRTFFVHPDFQRQESGARLLGKLENAAVGLGLRRIIAEVSLTGIPFYERHGYSRTGKMIDGNAGNQIEVEKIMHGNRF